MKILTEWAGWRAFFFVFRILCVTSWCHKYTKQNHFNSRCAGQKEKTAVAGQKFGGGCSSSSTPFRCVLIAGFCTDLRSNVYNYYTSKRVNTRQKHTLDAIWRARKCLTFCRVRWKIKSARNEPFFSPLTRAHVRIATCEWKGFFLCGIECVR